MADAPKLNSATDATAGRYATLSWLAVLSLVVAVLFVVLLLWLSWQAYSTGQPLMQWWLFVFPVAGVLLAFVARREVQNSEGARTDKGMAGAAWWACVVGGACYFAYLLANDLAVRAESEQVVVKWADKLAAAKPAEAGDKATWEAFEKTLDPGSPMVGNPQAAYLPQVAMHYGQFRNTPLLLVWARNRDAATFTPNGLRTWDLATDGKLTCEAAATLSCPEGDFPVVIGLQGVVADPKTKVRTWQVVPGQQFKFIDLDTAPRTRYGWMIDDLQREAANAADQFFLAYGSVPPFGPSLAIDRYMGPHRSADYTERLGKPEGLAFRLMLVGPSAILVGPTDPTQVPAADRSPHFFTGTSGQPHTDAPFTRPDGQKVPDGGLSTLQKVWAQPTLSLIGPAFRSRLRNPDMAPRFPLVDTADPARVVVKVPVDFHPRRDEFTGKTFSTGLLVMVCDDPAALKDLTAARDDAKAGRDKPKAEYPGPSRPFPFRVVRFESDLLPVAAPEAQPGGPGGG